MKALKVLVAACFAALLLSCDFGPTGGGTGGEGLSGNIVDLAGNPVAGAKIGVFPEDYDAEDSLAPGPKPSFVYTDSAGRFSLTGVTAGRYNVEAAVQRGDSTLALISTGIDIRSTVNLGTKTLKPAATLLVQVYYLKNVPLEEVRCYIPGTSYSVPSDSTGLCRMTVAAGTHQVWAYFPGMHRTHSDSLHVEPGDVNDEATLILYPKEHRVPRTTASIMYIGKNEFTDSVVEGNVLLTIVVGGQAICDRDSLVRWDSGGGFTNVEFTFMGLGEAFDGIDDLEAGRYENRPASRSEDMFYDFKRQVDLQIDSVIGTEVVGHYVVKDSLGAAIRKKTSFRAIKCPDSP